jgi:histone H3/H4
MHSHPCILPARCHSALVRLEFMDVSTQKILESATHRSLHSQGFSRSSSQASLVLNDLLSRYLTLLTSTCAKYAQHAGRTGLTLRDALSALDELGAGVDELGEYASGEGHELRRYAIHTGRRCEELKELKGE